MSSELTVLLVTAVSIGFFHTLMGPDHYLPFVVMAVARKWSPARTGLITLICGIGHVLSSVVLGFVGVAMGLALRKLEAFEGMRGDWAALEKRILASLRRRLPLLSILCPSGQRRVDITTTFPCSR